MSDNKHFEKKLHDFRNNLQSRGFHRATADSYYFGLKKFFGYLHENGVDCNVFTSQDVVRYKQLLLDHKNAPQTINVALCAIKKYADYIGVDCAVEMMRTKKKENVMLFDINTLLKHITEISKNEVIRCRDTLIMKLFYYVGMRVEELTKIKKQDIHGHVLKINNRDIILNTVLQEDLNNFLRLTNLEKNDYLFIAYSSNNTKHAYPHLTTRSVENIFNKYKKIINNNLSLNDLRNIFLLHLKQQPLSIEIDVIHTHVTMKTDRDYLSSSTAATS